MITAQQEKQTINISLTPKSKHFMLFSFFLWQILAILLVEFILYLTHFGEQEIFKLDPVLGFKHMRNKSITWREEGFAQSYFNEDGMREPGLKLVLPLNTFRIALLGDSMVEGLQVPIEETFGQMAARNLSTSCRKKVEVLNFGVSGYSTAQEYLQLKRQVLKYRPHLVLLCYNSRDMFENWSPPDQVITNVRPYALHLPGGKLIIDNSPVTAWLKSPRAKFLLAIDWLRHNSRIWGLWSACELNMSLHNPLYRAILTLLTNPKKAAVELAKPVFQIKFFEQTAHNSDKANLRDVQAAKSSFNSAAPNVVLSQNPLAQKKDNNANKGKEGNKLYRELVFATLSSLLNEMKKECAHVGSDFAVIVLPVRAALCPMPGMETTFLDIDYRQERLMVSDICTKHSIPLLDVEKLAEQLPHHKRGSLFYAAHLNSQGQQFLADSLTLFLKPYARKR